MGKNAALQCRCGAVRGVVADAAPGAVNRAVCYCDDCQAYLHHLGRTDLFDAHGGTDVVQVAPASLSFIQGKDRIQGLRLSPKGLHRWYASCCKTPLGNTVGPAMPFIGIVARVFDSASQKTDDVFGPPIGAVHGKFAVGDAPDGSADKRARRLVRRTVAARQRLADTEDALNRLAAGNFGECEQCGAPIPVVVLFPAPESRYCPGCAGAALRTDARERVH